MSREITLDVTATLEENERRLIMAALDHCGWNRKAAAEMLGISRKTLYNKLLIWKVEGRLAGVVDATFMLKADPVEEPITEPPPPPLLAVELEHVRRALAWAKGNISLASRILGVSMPTVRRKIEAMQRQTSRDRAPS